MNCQKKPDFFAARELKSFFKMSELIWCLVYFPSPKGMFCHRFFALTTNLSHKYISEYTSYLLSISFLGKIRLCPPCPPSPASRGSCPDKPEKNIQINFLNKKHFIRDNLTTAFLNPAALSASAALAALAPFMQWVTTRAEGSGLGKLYFAEKSESLSFRASSSSGT